MAFNLKGFSPVGGSGRAGTRQTGSVSSVADNGDGTVTVTTSVAHGIKLPNEVTLNGMVVSAYDGTFKVGSVPSTTTFTITLVFSATSTGKWTANYYNAPAVWSYGTPDTPATVKTDGYFNELRDIVNKNDTLLLASAGGAAEDFSFTSFNIVDKSPATTNVTLSTLDNQAAA